MIAQPEPDAATHLVVVSIGNTRTAMATRLDGKRGQPVHLPTEPTAAVADGAAQLWGSLPVAGRRAVVIGSVYPAALAAVRRACQHYGMDPVHVVGEDLDLPLGVDLPAPEKVGIDRLCVAAAAYERVRGACVVADFGTALTIDLVADNGVFLGGTILPGVALSARALHEHTAQLPLVEVGCPTETLGKDTASAIRNGIYAMMAGAVREIAERYATQIGKWPPLVLTGGDAEAIARACDFADAVMPDLALDGLVLAYDRQHAASDDD